jgi:hypothetical protein
MKSSKANRVISLLTALSFGALMLALSGCSPGGDPAIVGKWQVKDDQETVEIRGDGNWVEGKKDPDVISAKWNWEGTNYIRVTFKHKLVGTATGTLKVTLQGDTLILKDSDGATEYARVK